MSNDRFGVPLKVGDVVCIGARVVHVSDVATSIVLETIEPPAPEHDGTALWLEASQVMKVEENYVERMAAQRIHDAMNLDDAVLVVSNAGRSAVAGRVEEPPVHERPPP